MTLKWRGWAGILKGMGISEGARSDLYTGLRDVLGPDRAETLMSAISLDGLDAVATKSDIAELEASLTNRIDELRARTTTWVLGLAVTNIGAVVSVALIVR